MTSYTIGAQMYSMRDRTQTAEGLLEALKGVKAAGYNSCQLSGLGPIPPERVREILDETQMVCGATHLSFERMQGELDQVIAEHRLWGCVYPGVGAMPERYRGSREGFEAFARDCNQIARRFREEGMHFIYHNHAFEFARLEGGVTGYQLLLDQFSPDMQLELDTYWVQAGGMNPLEWIGRVAGRMDVVHFKDMTGGPAGPVMAPVGDGNLNWPEILAACERIGVKWAFVEQDNAVETDSLHCMTVSHDHLAQLDGRF